MCIIAVSALAAEWIEIGVTPSMLSAVGVSALAAEWIEIAAMAVYNRICFGLRPRGGVD